MKIFSKDSVFGMILALAVVGIASGAVLVLVYNYSMPKIKVNVNAETDRGIRKLFFDASRITYDKEEKIYRVEDETGKLLGYAFIAEGNGYQGVIKLLVGVNASLSEIMGIEVLESQETPGLGAEIAEPDFRKQFAGLSTAHPIELLKNQEPTKKYQVEAVTGATISSRAVVSSINRKLEKVRRVLRKK
ncbi:MAG: FMN-binding protein [Candidatus Omnitrophica bacterium]|nr:FMN-binding protein [Candidatus Omnitrophota bacterium]